MNDLKKSDTGIVARKPANKAAQAAAEPVERRPVTNGNPQSQSVSSQPVFPNHAKRGCQRVPATDAGVRQGRTPVAPAVAV